MKEYLETRLKELSQMIAENDSKGLPSQEFLERKREVLRAINALTEKQSVKVLTVEEAIKAKLKTFETVVVGR